MQKQTIDLPVGSSLTRLVAVLSAWIAQAPARVTIEPIRDTRSIQQNAYLWGCCYAPIVKVLNEIPDAGHWTDKDLHEHFLGEKYGVDIVKGFGKTYERPKRRSSKLNTEEMGKYWELIHYEAADKYGIYIADPDPSLRTR